MEWKGQKMRNTTTIQSGYHLIFRHLFSVCLACLSVLLICTLSHAAGINTDGSLGTATTLTPGGPKGNDYTIPSDIGQQRGSNLFHSFGNFNVNTGESATFTGSAGTANVIGRVTGGNSSWIDGRLGCDITGANLWLLNPFGILFGPNASLNVNGSFHASTADYLQLSDGGVFYTDPSKTSKLTIAAPSAFGFLSSKPEGITIDGSSLSVKSGKTLFLIGGNINIVNGQLIAPSGKINLVSLASPGEVVLNEDGIAVTGSPELGDIRISTKTDEASQLLSTTRAVSTVLQPRDGTDESKDEMILEQSGSLRNKLAGQASWSLIDVSGSEKDATSSGSVDIYCKKFSLDGEIRSYNYSNYKGGKMRLVAEESVSIDNFSPINSDSYGEGAGGDIDIQTGYLALTNVGQINANTYGSGNGGNVTIKAKDVSIDGKSSNGTSASGIYCNASTDYSGNAGSLKIDTESLTLSNNGQIGAVTFGGGNGGNVTIKAKDVSIDGDSSMIACRTQSTGNAGNLNIDTESLKLSNGGLMEAATLGNGNGGNVTIEAKDVLIDSGMITCRTQSTGNAGNLNIDTESLTLSNDGQMGANTSGIGNGGNVTIKAKDVLIDNGMIICDTESTGNGGNVDIDTESLKLSNGGQISASISGSGDGGNVTIKAKDASIDGGFKSSNGAYGTGIYCRADLDSTGDAGSLNIDTKSLTLSNGGEIEASTSGRGNGGNVTIKAKDVSIDGYFEISKSFFHPSMISCDTQSTGNAGSLKIDTESLTLSNGGQISTSTFGSGNGGDVTIKAKDVSIDGGFESSKGFLSMISCQTNPGSTGDAGSLNIDTESLTLSNGGQLVAATFSSGEGGHIIIKAKAISIDGGSEASDGVYVSVISCQTTPSSTGDAGSLNIDTESLTLSNGGRIIAATFGSGDGGDVTIKAKAISIDGGSEDSNYVYISMISCQATPSSTGDAGSLNINTESLTLSNGGQISASTSGSGDGGNVTIKAKDVSIEGGFESSNGLYLSKITCQTNTGSTGNAGNLNIDTELLTLSNGGQVSASTSGSGDGGNVTIKAKDVSIEGGFESSNGLYLSKITCQTNSGSTGNAGSLNVDTESLTLSNGGQISASTYSSGDGGDVTIKAKCVSIDGGFKISNGFVHSMITCESGSVSSGKAGNIGLQADTLSMSNGGEISVKNSGKKPGGSIDINVANLTMNSGAVISSASTGTGDAGNNNVKVSQKQ